MRCSFTVWRAGLAALGATVSLAGLAAAAGFAAGQPARAPARAQESPPVIASATVDAQRRLVVAYSAPDTMTYGGHLYIDSDPNNDPAAGKMGGDPRFGQFMYCSNTSSCKGRWTLATSTGTGPFTFITEALDCTTFPPGTWWAQVEGYNQDKMASTRQWEESNIVKVALPACGATTTGSSETGGATASGRLSLTFTAATRIYHADGTATVTKAGAPAVLVDEDVIRSAAKPIALAIAEGRVVLGPKAQLQWLDGQLSVGTPADPRYQGEVVFEQKQFALAGEAGKTTTKRISRQVVAVGPTTTVTITGAATVLLQATAKGDAVTVLAGKATAKAGPDDSKGTVVKLGFRLFKPAGSTAFDAPTKAKPPASPFWK